MQQRSGSKCGGMARAAGRWTVLRVEKRARPNFWLASASAGYGSGSGNYLGRKSPVMAPHVWQRQRIRAIGTVAAPTTIGAAETLAAVASGVSR